MKRQHAILLVVLLLMAVALACNFNRAVSTPVPTVPVSTEAVESLETAVGDAFQQAQTNGTIELEITEAQLTSLIAFELEERGAGYISNPQVFLQDGQVQMTARVARQGLSASARAVLTVQIDPLGRPVFDVISATVGPLPLPGDIITELEERINLAFQQQLDSLAPNLTIESIVIDDGVMQITGRTN